MNKVKDFIKNIGKTKLIIGLSCILAIVIAVITLGITFSNNDINVFNNVELKDVEIDTLELNTIDIEEENGTYTYKAVLLAKEPTEVNYVEILIKDSEGKEIVTLIGYVGKSLSQNEVFNISASTDADISKLNSIDYKVVK